MKELIIGASGFIGSNLCRHLPDAERSTRKDFDLLNPTPLPTADIVYLCAGVNGTLTCARDPQRSYRANVDGTLSVAEQCIQRGSFMVWISSTTVEWLGEHYGRQKRVAENYLRAFPVGIVRAGRVVQNNVDDLCKLMVDIGRNRRSCITIWGEDEQPYQR